MIDSKNVLYKARFYGGKNLDQEMGWIQITPKSAAPVSSCLVRPLGDRRPSDMVGKDAPDDHPLRYGVMKIWIHQQQTISPTSSVHLHFYDLGPERGYRIVGIERPNKPITPDLY